jgi:two-component system sensor histidine kinase QseC
MTSIRRYLVTLLIAVLTLCSFLAALQSYRQSISRADQLLDADLTVLAASLMLPYQQFLLTQSSGPTTALADAESLTPSFSQPPASDANKVHNAVQIWQGQQLLFRSANAPGQRILAPEGFSEQNFAGQRWRTYRQPDTAELQIIVAQPLQQRQSLTDEVVLASIYPVVLSLPLQALFIWLVVSRGLTPLIKFAEQLASKKADDLTPVQLSQAPQELVQVLASTNQLLARLEDAFAREKRFASDVAHELRTPLSVLQVNLHNASLQWQQAGVADPAGVMPALQQGVERMSQLIEQIMLLNRTNPAHFQAKLQRFDISELCREVIADLYPKIADKQQQIELIGAQSCWLYADAFAVRLMLVNLLGNAIKYTPIEGQFILAVEPLAANSKGDGDRQLQQADHARLAGQQVRLVLEDSGPGIAATEYDRVFDRFYRIGGDRHQSGEPGSGLGLAIVRDIVLLHQGSLQLAPSQFPTGLKVTVQL